MNNKVAWHKNQNINEMYLAQYTVSVVYFALFASVSVSASVSTCNEYAAHEQNDFTTWLWAECFCLHLLVWNGNLTVCTKWQEALSDRRNDNAYNK